MANIFELSEWRREREMPLEEEAEEETAASENLGLKGGSVFAWCRRCALEVCISLILSK